MLLLGDALVFIFFGIPQQDDLGDHNVRRFSQTRGMQFYELLVVQGFHGRIGRNNGICRHCLVEDFSFLLVWSDGIGYELHLLSGLLGVGQQSVCQLLWLR